MKKTNVKKLVLTKETVRSLEELANVRGGYSGISCDTGCYEPNHIPTKWC